MLVISPSEAAVQRAMTETSSQPQKMSTGPPATSGKLKVVARP